MTNHTDRLREEFEDAAFKQYFLSTIKRNPSPPQPKIAGCLDFISTADKTKAEFTAKAADDSYVEEEMNPAWWAWQECSQLRAQAAVSEGCPCHYTTPCSPDCSCVNPFSSRGCSRCCKYGSQEQRKRNAERLSATPLPPAVPAQRWVGCGECDCTFDCHEGRARCIRLSWNEDPDALHDEFMRSKEKGEPHG